MAAITNALIDQDKSADLKEECSAHLDSLMALGQAKTEYFAEKIYKNLLGASQGTDKTFPITTIQSYTFETKAYADDNAKNIADVVNGAIKGFVADDSVGATGTLISGFVNALFGSTAGSEAQIERYCAILEGVSMIRLDFCGWSRVVKSSALKSKCDKVSAFVLYRSIVDMSKISLNDFTAVYQHTVKAENPDLDTANIIKKCQEIYYIFNPKNNITQLSNAREGKIFTPTKGHNTFDIFKKDVIIL